jgi:hypothetical protein
MDSRMDKQRNEAMNIFGAALSCDDNRRERHKERERERERERDVCVMIILLVFCFSLGVRVKLVPYFICLLLVLYFVVTHLFLYSLQQQWVMEIAACCQFLVPSEIFWM